jgi:hypothetical protein
VIINGPHWPHFICPNCRSVADLEAELDDPYANGEWEELASVEVAAPEQRAESAHSEPADVTPGVNNTSEAHGLPLETETRDSEHGHVVLSDIEVSEASDDSGVNQRVNQATQEIASLNIDDSPSPSETADSHPPHSSNATVSPVDIIARKPVANSAGNISSHLEQPDSHSERSFARTPSPNGMSSSLAVDTLIGTEGPMTPRNDVGPFIFDGSAGRAADIRLDSMTTINLNSAANIPPAPPSAA